jgi:hypothetical protein
MAFPLLWSVADQVSLTVPEAAENRISVADHAVLRYDRHDQVTARQASAL